MTPAAPWTPFLPGRLRLALARAQVGALAVIGLALACLWYLDALTTTWALQNGAFEAGPLMAHVVDRGSLALLGAKAFGLALILGLAGLQVASGKGQSMEWGLGAVGALSLGIVTWNLLTILRIAGVV